MQLLLPAPLCLSHPEGLGSWGLTSALWFLPPAPCPGSALAWWSGKGLWRPRGSSWIRLHSQEAPAGEVALGDLLAGSDYMLGEGHDGQWAVPRLVGGP